MKKTFFALTLFAGILAAAHKIPRNDYGHQLQGGSTTTVYVGPYNWPQHHEPMWRYNTAPGALGPRYDFPAVTCNPDTDECTAPCPLAFSCESGVGHNLPNGTEVKFGTSGQLPAPLRSWAEDNWAKYYIRDSTPTTFRLSESPGGDPIDIAGAGAGTHGMSFAGYTTVIRIEGGGSLDFTCEPGTDICTAPGHPFAAETSGLLTSSDRLPAPLAMRYGGTWLKHCFVPVDANRFRIKRINNPDSSCSTQTNFVTFTDAGSGTHSIWTRSAVITLWSISGYPQGTTFSFRRSSTVQMAPTYSTVRRKISFANNEPLVMYAKVPASSPPGDYRISIQTSESETSLVNPESLAFTLTAKQLNPLPKNGPASYPPIPGVELWKDILVSSDRGGGTHPGSSRHPLPRCPNPENPSFDVGFPSNSGQQIWFYDGGMSYYEMADYLGNPVWRNCGNYIALDIAKGLLASGTQGYLYAFTRTLAQALAQTADPTYAVALSRTADRAFGHQNAAGLIDDFGLRQQSFSFARNLVWRRVSGAQSYYEGDYVTSLVGMIDEISNGGTLYGFHQPFMIGLAMRELTDYYLEHNDERIPVVLSQYLNRFWNEWYDTSSHRMRYNPEGYGPRCRTDCLDWTGAVLNNFISPGYAFIWRLTGDEWFLARGDDMFQYQFGPSFNEWPYQAKNWSEMNYWVWDFIRWREGRMRAN